MKKEIRVLGIDDAPFNKFKDKKTLLIGVFFRGGNFLDGVVSTSVSVDGTDSTTKMINLVKKTKLRPQLQFIMLDGIAVGGFNVVDITRLSKRTRLPVIVVMRKYPEITKMKRVLKRLKMEKKIQLLEKAGEIHKVGKIHVQLAGCTLEKAKEILKITCTRSYVPEPIRVAHIMASGVTFGESRGKA